MKLAAMLWLGLAAQDATLVLDSKPVGATVTVKGLKGAWTTPCEIPVPGGRSVDVMIARQGFETLMRRLEVKPKARASVVFTLTPRATVKIEEPEPPKKNPVVAEAVLPEPVRLKVMSPGGAVRVTSGGKVVAETEAKAGAPLEFAVPPGRIRIDHLGAKGGSPTHTVEILPGKPSVERRPRERVGEVQLVHRIYGVYLKLDSGLPLVPGEEIAIFRDGREVARSRILQVIGRDETYPDGAAQVARSGMTIHKGDEARRLK